MEIEVQKKDNVSIRKPSYSIFQRNSVAYESNSQSLDVIALHSNFTEDDIHRNRHYSEDLGVGVILYDIESQSNDADKMKNGGMCRYIDVLMHNIYIDIYVYSYTYIQIINDIYIYIYIYIT
jgi:hypothetical protein